MPINKNALIRYRALDRCLKNTTRKYSAKDLLREVERILESEGFEKGIVKSQLHADMQYMQDFWKAPILAEKDSLDRRITLYRYSDPLFSIENQPISEVESKVIKEALSVLSRFKGMPQFEWINEIVPAIQDKLGFIAQDREVISFESNWDYEGLRNITPIFNAITNHRVLKITYQDFRADEPYSIFFHPYYLKQYNSRWFAFGLNEASSNSYWNLALDRIQDIVETQDEYQYNEIDWEEYFDDIIGVTRRIEDELEEVRLWFPPEQAPYIKTKPLHRTQKCKEDATGLEVSIKVVLNFELERTILSFGSSMKVLAPDKLKNQIKSKLQLSLSRYED
ncbi:WYL domain-containing protein [Adhaeribacter aerolatus]|uniref:WYL domain-containing protein n=1 Tax=Adhaeribacter aerolatus TaxID=670289 RepID=A0A512AUF9_9BACT|nr:WYL domain-containing protein [Adhaeribacter aerolatus]GEO03349.1 WYL domain-containing protein [Adhaeribacter aerolatus]